MTVPFPSVTHRLPVSSCLGPGSRIAGATTRRTTCRGSAFNRFNLYRVPARIMFKIMEITDILQSTVTVTGEPSASTGLPREASRMSELMSTLSPPNSESSRSGTLIGDEYHRHRSMHRVWADRHSHSGHARSACQASQVGVRSGERVV